MILLIINRCLQISSLTLPSLGGHELGGVEHEEPNGGLHADQHLLEDGAEKYKCRFCSLKTSVLADIQTHMREVGQLFVYLSTHSCDYLQEPPIERAAMAEQSTVPFDHTLILFFL